MAVVAMHMCEMYRGDFFGEIMYNSDTLLM